MEELNLKCYAHLGDAVYEVFIREKVIYMTSSLAKMHKIRTKLVCAEFQCKLLEAITPHLTEKELDLVRRGRNLPTSSARKSNHNIHRIATAFEVLMGYLYLHDRERRLVLLNVISDYIDEHDQILEV